eukprot:c19466_g1_i1.p1 GENE.c19466_g1_i1~~c19466_g1_i1.p1  ORF type:complete len:169 (-),score=36.63 c19466_g1_i1:75-581(-)
MDRVVAQLLSELDGIQSSGTVFVMAATNRPDLVDPSLLRPGRFDRLLYLGVSDTTEQQLKLLQAITRKFRLDKSVDLESVAAALPKNLTGADLYALCSDAMLHAISRKVEQIDQGDQALNAMTNDQLAAVVVQHDFELALASLVPSVSPAELERYRSIQSKFDSERNL